MKILSFFYNKQEIIGEPCLSKNAKKLGKLRKDRAGIKIPKQIIFN